MQIPGTINTYIQFIVKKRQIIVLISGVATGCPVDNAVVMNAASHL